MRRIVKCYGWFVVLSLLAGGASSGYYAQKKPDLFEASATVVAGPSDRAGNYESALRGLDTVSRRNVMATYAQVPSSRTVRDGVLQELVMPKGQAHAYRVRASILPDTNVLRITVQGPAPQLTADFANAVVLKSRQLMSGIYGGIVTFDVLDKAMAPGKAVDRGTKRKVVLGALCGLFVSLGLTFLIERFRLRHAGTAVNIPDNSRADRCLGQHA